MIGLARLSPWLFSLAYVGVSVIGGGAAMLGDMAHPAVGLAVGLGLITVWARLCVLRLRDMGQADWLHRPATTMLLICWAMLAAVKAGWIAPPLAAAGPVGDALILFVATLMLGFYLTLMTTPTRAAVAEEPVS